MKQSKSAFALVMTVLAAPILSGVAACDESKEIQAWVEKANQLRIEAVKQGDIVPYRQPQYKALKDYFAELNRMALALKNDASLTERFNKAVALANLEETCGKVFVARSEWGAMVERCTRNRYFLCSDEVRAYPELVGAMRGKLVPAQLKRFEQAPKCRAALESN